MHTSEIKFSITLDESKLPDTIKWSAPDAGMEGEKDCKSIMISIWDKKDPGTLRIDLWTKEMMVDEMQRFVYETLRSLADTYERSTHNEKGLSDDIRKFSDEFGKKAGIFA